MGQRTWRNLFRISSLALVVWLMLNPFVRLQKNPGTAAEDTFQSFMTSSSTSRNSNNSVDSKKRNQISHVLAAQNNFGFNSTGSILQQHFETLPAWMQEYFQWHHKLKQTLLHNHTLQKEWKAGILKQNVMKQNATATTQQDFPKLLILQCLQSNQKCGGAADRLKPLPLLLLAAARSQRLLLIRWTRPFALQEFLRPPLTRGIADDNNNNNNSYNNNCSNCSYRILDWTVPTWLEELFRRDDSYTGFSRIHIHNVDQVLPRTIAATDTDIVTTLIQWHDGGQLIYDAQLENKPAKPIQSQGTDAATQSQNKESSEFRRTYHALWRLCFEPVPPIAQKIQQTMQEKGLIPGQYTVAQYRAFYRERQAPPNVEMQQRIAINAVQCASHLRQTDTEPVYFASDSRHAVDVVRDYSQHYHRPVVSMDHHEELLHLDRGHDEPGRKPEDYFPLFVDLYLMGNGRCMSFGKGGFARFGLILSYNYTCESRHFWKGKMIPCQWGEQN